MCRNFIATHFFLKKIKKNFVPLQLQMFKIKTYHKLITSLILAVLVFFVVRYALPKPKTIGFIFMLVPLFDVWIDYWIRTNQSQIPQRTAKVFSWFFYASIIGFLSLIIALWISPMAYWTPLLRVYAYGLILILVSIKIIWAKIFLLQFLISKISFSRKISSPKRWFQISILVAIFMFGSALYGAIYEKFSLRVHRVNVRDSTIPKGFDCYKIVQFSDMHIGSQVWECYVKKLVDSINAQNPDLVVFTGDMVNFHSEEIEKFIPLLSRIRAKDGVLRRGFRGFRQSRLQYIFELGQSERQCRKCTAIERYLSCDELEIIIQ